MADQYSTPPAPGRASLLQKGRDMLAVGVAFLRRIPYLGTGAALLGVVVLCFITTRDAHALLTDRPESQLQQYRMALDHGATKEFIYSFFLSHWKLGVMLLLPALLLALIRFPARQFGLPVTLASLAFFLLWLGWELHANFERAHTSVMGEVPAPGAYMLKLGIIGATILSLPLLFLLYHRSSIMDRYLIRNFAAPFLLCLLGIIAIMITMDLLNNANDFLKANFGFGDISSYYLQQIPQIVVMIMDAAILLASLYTLSRMSRFNEIISMLGAGRSLVRVLLPLLILGGWCSLFALAMNYEWAPAAQNVKDAMLRNADKSEKRRRLERNSTYNVMYRNRDQNRTWFLNRVPNSLETGEPIDFAAVIQDDGSGNLVKAWYGRRATWNAAANEWRFFGASILDPKVIKETGIVQRFERLPIPEPWTETPWSILSDKINPEYLSVPELASYLKTNANLPAGKLARYEATLHSRFSLPFRCLLMVLIAGPLGIVSGRRGVLGGVASAVFIFIIIYFLYTIVLKSGEGGYIPGWMSAWIVNGVFALVGLVLLWMRNYNRSLPKLNLFKAARHSTR